MYISVDDSEALFPHFGFVNNDMKKARTFSYHKLSYVTRNGFAIDTKMGRSFADFFAGDVEKQILNDALVPYLISTAGLLMTVLAQHHTQL